MFTAVPTGDWRSLSCAWIERPANWDCATGGRRIIQKANRFSQTPTRTTRTHGRGPGTPPRRRRGGRRGPRPMSGTSWATPVYRKDGSLLGVLGVTFGLATLSQNLTDLKVGETGYAFVVEFRRDGAHRLIAHPQPEILMRAAPGGAAGPSRELAPIEEVADQRVPAFLKACELPTDFHPANLKEMQRISFTHNGVSYFGSYHCLSTSDTPDWLICILIPEKDILARVEASNRETFLIS